MEVSLSLSPKWSKTDHLFLLLAENTKPPKHVELPKGVAKLIEASRFSGRSDESITLLADEPRKVTLLGLGKEASLTIRSLRATLYAIAKIAKKQRDNHITVVLGPALPGMSDENIANRSRLWWPLNRSTFVVE